LDRLRPLRVIPEIRVIGDPAQSVSSSCSNHCFLSLVEFSNVKREAPVDLPDQHLAAPGSQLPAWQGQKLVNDVMAHGAT